jgi:dipeptidyl aminopeptidase/acylaminoacyl peptidase
MNFALAWVYVSSLTHPGCPGLPDPLPGSGPVEAVWLPAADGLSILAWYYPSKNGAAVITLGGMNGALGDRLPHAAPLLQSGFGVLQIDSRACAKPPAAVTLGASEDAEAAAALDFLKNRTEVDPQRIGIMGFSMGGAAAIRAAARNPGLAAVLAEGGYFNLGDDILEPEERLGIARRVFLYSVAGVYWWQTGSNPWEVSPVDELPAISPRPLLLIYGENETLDAHAYEQYSTAGEPKDLWVVPGGAHGRNHLAAPVVYAQQITSFFQGALLANP